MIALPAVEAGIAASLLVLRLLIAASAFAGVGGALIVAVFALFHGHAHGAEIRRRRRRGCMPATSLATGSLHAAGIVAGRQWVAQRPWLARAAGLALSAGGTWMLLG